jgi:hypothetical protein
MKVPSQKQQLIIVTIALRVVVWLVFILFILADGIANSRTISDALYWLPWVGIGLLFAVSLDDFITDDRSIGVVLLALPYYVLADFVQG